MIKNFSTKMPFNLRYELFYQMAKTLGIIHYAINGKCEEFIGHLYDKSVIKPYMKDGSFSENIVDIIVKHISGSADSVFIDVGANIRIVTIRVSSQTAEDCIAIEPDDGNFRILKANLAMNSVESVRLLNAAVGARAGKASFTRSAFNSGDHRISPNGENLVDVIILNDLILSKNYKYIAVKIDPQGAEPLIFEGGGIFLEKANLIIAEYWPWGMNRMGVDAGPVVKFIQKTKRGGYLLTHGQHMESATCYSCDDMVSHLQSMAEKPSENAQVDLVLIK